MPIRVIRAATLKRLIALPLSKHDLEIPGQLVQIGEPPHHAGKTNTTRPIECKTALGEALRRFRGCPGCWSLGDAESDTLEKINGASEMPGVYRIWYSLDGCGMDR